MLASILGRLGPGVEVRNYNNPGNSSIVLHLPDPSYIHLCLPWTWKVMILDYSQPSGAFNHWIESINYKIVYFSGIHSSFFLFTENVHKGRVHSKKKKLRNFLTEGGEGVRTNFPHFLNFFIFIFSCPNSCKSAEKIFF